MLLYHGTPNEFSEPSLAKCKPHRDFGCGFYLAQNYFDALPMAIKNSTIGFVQTYELDDSKCRFGNRKYGRRRSKSEK